MKIENNFELLNYNSFKVSVVAKHFCIVRNVDEVKEALAFAKSNNLKYFILGSGSNILFKNKFFDGLVIKNDINYLVENDDNLEVGSGYFWDNLVKYSVENNIYGFENLSYIPGTVGAAPVQNIGAYGAEVSNLIVSVNCLDTDTLEEVSFTNSQAEFAYRESIFKKHLSANKYQKYFILSVNFKKDKHSANNMCDKLDTEYKDIINYLEQNNLQKSDLTLVSLREIIIDIRNSKLPDWRAEGAPGTAGSFFQNIIIEEEKYLELLGKNEEYKNIPAFESEAYGKKFYKLSVGYILDKILGIKDFKIGQVSVYYNQALVIVNWGGASGDEIYEYSEQLIQKCRDTLGLELEREVNIIV
ncbi:MAG: UDP-N-acetylmuramate dehydrogenase [Patescibacteria group bacterium]|nr:UDP-N-acetylmuramate dehydrogenase [Patescibacteria group bacterium]